MESLSSIWAPESSTSAGLELSAASTSCTQILVASSLDRFELNDAFHDENPCRFQIPVIATSVIEAIGGSSSTGVSLSSKEADSRTGRATGEPHTALFNFSGPFREVTRKGRTGET